MDDECLRCDEEVPWDVLYPWLTPIRLIVERNKAWAWSVNAGTSVNVKHRSSGEERRMVQVATLSTVDWVLAADLDAKCVVLLVHGTPSFFIYPRDPWCDWRLVSRTLDTYSLPEKPAQDTTTSTDDEEEEEEEEESKNGRVFVDRYVPPFDHQERYRGRDQEEHTVASRGHYLAFTPVSAAGVDRVPFRSYTQDHHVPADLHTLNHIHAPFNNGNNTVFDTHSPRLSLRSPGDFLSWGDA